MKVADRIKALETQRTEKFAVAKALLEKIVTEERSFTEDELKQQAELETAIAGLNAQIASFESAEALLAKAAKPIKPVVDAATRPTVEPQPREVVPDSEKGLDFARWAICLGIAKGNQFEAAAMAQARWGENSRMGRISKSITDIARRGDNLLEVINKAATDPISSDEIVGSGGGLAMMDLVRMSGEYVDLLRPQTIVGRIPGLRRLTFGKSNVITIPGGSTGTTGGWVGENNSIVVQRPTWTQMQLTSHKLACIVPTSNEMLRWSNPSIESLIRDDMIQGAAGYIDVSFLSAAAAGANPAGILLGLSSQEDMSSATPDLAAVTLFFRDIILAQSANNAPMRSPVWIMHPAVFEYVRTQRDGNGNFSWKAEMDSGKLFGFPVIQSTAVPTSFGAANTTPVVLLDGANVFWATDAGVMIDTSTEAAIQSDTAPATPPTPLISAFQQDMTFFRIRQSMDWKRRYSLSVSYGTWKLA